eukprot:CAMPEP_0179973038 /NCGR_PEP_ID=MMETSP0983-20121128/37121_1 /TAXON_ID=483367 /ORGANISM="non described non described, Strain CCMP 2436" /LENGTH=98 /DNA_ID=CAMNT_0021888749 /DNA_START=489 /DNA_END=785 /DNA_ORIENTATION=+
MEAQRSLRRSTPTSAIAASTHCVSPSSSIPNSDGSKKASAHLNRSLVITTSDPSGISKLSDSARGWVVVAEEGREARRAPEEGREEVRTDRTRPARPL